MPSICSKHLNTVELKIENKATNKMSVTATLPTLFSLCLLFTFYSNFDSSIFKFQIISLLFLCKMFLKNKIYFLPSYLTFSLLVSGNKTKHFLGLNYCYHHLPMTLIRQQVLTSPPVFDAEHSYFPSCLSEIGIRRRRHNLPSNVCFE